MSYLDTAKLRDWRLAPAPIVLDLETMMVQTSILYLVLALRVSGVIVTSPINNAIWTTSGELSTCQAACTAYHASGANNASQDPTSSHGSSKREIHHP